VQLSKTLENPGFTFFSAATRVVVMAMTFGRSIAQISKPVIDEAGLFDYPCKVTVSVYCFLSGLRDTIHETSV
jgi:hypothetical protein